MAADASSRVVATWLAPPEAADRFNPSRLAGRDRDEWGALQTARRRRDWASSRALLSAVSVASDQRSSLSHSHGFAAVALAPQAVALGIDVEWMRPRKFLGMASIAYCADECALLASLADPTELCSTFYELWTLKEAFGKALQLPLLDALRQCRFVDAGLGRSADVPTDRLWRATVFAPRPQLRLAVACIADTRAQLDSPLETFEWPQPRRCEWTIIRRFAGGGPGARAC